MNAADTNWVARMFIAPDTEEDKTHRTTIDRFLRMNPRTILVSQSVVLEARNVFSRILKEPQPEEWTQFESDSRFYRDPINWDLTKRDVFALVARYSAKDQY
jgi:hypothetical protein